MNDRFVLAIDTSFGPVSAALVNSSGEIVAHFEADNAPGTQAETLPPRIAERLTQRSWSGLKHLGMRSHAGMAGAEHQIARSCIGLRIAQMVLGSIERVVAAVDPQERDIEVVTRKLEIIGVSTKERN